MVPLCLLFLRLTALHPRRVLAVLATEAVAIEVELRLLQRQLRVAPMENPFWAPCLEQQRGDGMEALQLYRLAI
jgi:hypothetical protein